MRLLCHLIQIAALIAAAHAVYSCKNLQGRNVDWFIIYKLPQISPWSGKEFAYLDADNVNWTVRSDINDPQHGIGLTIGQVYDSSKDDFYLMYSDDGPIGKADSYRGHAKGTALFSKTSGFWVVHSVPNYPPTRQYSYPSTAQKYGQTMICMTFNTDTLGDIAEQWRFMQATPYAHNLPDPFNIRFPTLGNVVTKKSLPKSATVFKSLKKMTTRGGVAIFSCSKHKKFNGDVWNDIISNEMGTKLAVESWLNGSGDDLHTTCTKQSETHDVKRVTVMGKTFNSASDHSKWGVSSSSGKPLVCIGDMNRQKSQLSRGGGAVCMMNPALWNVYFNMVTEVEPCKSSRSYTFYTMVLIIAASTTL